MVRSSGSTFESLHRWKYVQTCEVLEPSSSISVDQYLCVCVFACVPLDLVGCGSVGVGVGMGGGATNHQVDKTAPLQAAVSVCDQ